MMDVRQGKLCLRPRETGRIGRVANRHRMWPVVATTVTERVPVMSPVSLIDAQLRRIDTARRSGAEATAERLTDQLIDYVWGPDVPEGAA